MQKRYLFFLILLLAGMAGFCVLPDTSLIHSKNSRAWSLRSSNLDSSIILSNAALGLLKELAPGERLPKNWKEKTVAKTYYYLGFFYRDTGEPELAVDYLGKSLKIADSISDFFLKSQVLGAIGTINLNQGKFPKALEYYLKALQIAEEKGFKSAVSVQLANIGNVYDGQLNFPKALEYYGKALKIAGELNDQARISVQLGNIGMIYHETHDHAKALHYYNRALNLYDSLGNKNGVAIMLNNLAELYREQEDYARSLDYYAASLKLAMEQGNSDNIASFTGNIGMLYLALKNYKEAEGYLLKAVKMSEETRSLESIREFEAGLSALYAATGKDKLALEHYKKHISAKDSLFNAENTEKNVRLEMNYEFDKKQAIDKAIYDKQVLLLETENKAQKQLRLLLFAIIGLALLLLFIGRRAYVIKNQNAEFLSAESQRKEVLLQEVHHRINNNLQIISSLLDLQASSTADERLTEYLTQSQNRIQALSVLHELLYQNESAIEINMQEYLNKIADFHCDILSSKFPGVEMRMDVAPVLFPSRVAVPLGLVVNELVTNAIKYAFEGGDKGVIAISLRGDEGKKGKWVLDVSDNGKGMPAEPAAKRESLGLKLVAILARQINATFSRPGLPGASFVLSFSIPNKQAHEQ